MYTHKKFLHTCTDETPKINTQTQWDTENKHTDRCAYMQECGTPRINTHKRVGLRE